MPKLIDLTGQKFNRLLVKEKAFTKEGSINKHKWLCECECGNTILVEGYDIRKGLTKSCGCHREEEYLKNKNLVGQKFERLTVVNKSERTNEVNAIFWYCLCECGNTTETTYYALLGGKARSCGCINTEITANRNKIEFGEAAFNALYNVYRKGAIKRKLDFSLTKEEAKKLFQGTCFYCGIEPSNISKGSNGNFIYNGIDRFDNAIGYTPDNIVSCCSQCNYAKRNYGFLDFKEWARRLAKNLDLTL